MTPTMLRALLSALMLVMELAPRPPVSAPHGAESSGNGSQLPPSVRSNGDGGRQGAPRR